jgi:predicted AAA+ superfamily ATPase
MVIQRDIEANIEKSLFGGKLIIIYGARRVGKTTLAMNLLKKHAGRYINCDEPDVRLALTHKTSTELKEYFQGSNLIVIDEAQRVRNIGLTLKLAVDNLPDLQIVATGSSSFDLSNKINEPLTGRVIEFLLPPLLITEANNDRLEAERLLENRLRYGLYPEVVIEPEKGEDVLRSISKNYLYKDALEFAGLKNPEAVERLVSALALQIGQQVSYTELANIVSVDQKTVSSYVRLLELSFVIFRLPPLARNLRKEISKSRKIYFWDLGVRNAVINNFNPLSLRNDLGQMWENFVIMEKVKKDIVNHRFTNRYFWRTWDKQEVDFVEEAGGNFQAVEIKWNKAKKFPPKAWRENYPNSRRVGVDKSNYWQFINN